MIEIVQRSVCPTCGGTTKEVLPKETVFGYEFPRQLVDCCECNATGTVPRVLATFSDAAALDDKLCAVIGSGFTLGDSVDAVLAALGVSAFDPCPYCEKDLALDVHESCITQFKGAIK